MRERERRIKNSNILFISNSVAIILFEKSVGEAPMNHIFEERQIVPVYIKYSYIASLKKHILLLNEHFREIVGEEIDTI